MPWQVLEPTKGTYYFDTLDRAITYASNSDGYRFQGVIIEIAVRATRPLLVLTIWHALDWR